MNFGDRLAWLGGGDLRVLERDRRAKTRYASMGMVLLSTASLAVASMSFAMVYALKAPWWAALFIGLLWGFIILNLDRILILNIKPNVGKRQTIAIVISRVIIAAVLGAVISVPLTLRIFQPEINAELDTEQTAAQISSHGKQSQLPDDQELAQVTLQIAKDRAILAGQVTAVTAPNVTAAQQQLTSAQDTLKSDQKQEDTDYTTYECELYGKQCNGASGGVGNGPLARAAKKRYDQDVVRVNADQKAVTTAQTALTTAQTNAANANDSSVSEQQTAAAAELPTLEATQKTLQAQVDAEAKKNTDDIKSESGLLARIKALDAIDGADSTAAAVHWLIALLLFMIELLPVMVKLMNTLGPPTLYDRIAEMHDEDTFGQATNDRDDSMWRRGESARKQRTIHSDMVDREITLGVKANGYVADRMAQILDSALERWSQQVDRTLHTDVQGAPPPAGLIPGGGSPRPRRPAGVTDLTDPGVGAVPNGVGPDTAQERQQQIRTRFGLADGSDLA